MNKMRVSLFRDNFGSILNNNVVVSEVLDDFTRNYVCLLFWNGRWIK
jgi:hypothetical protein